VAHEYLRFMIMFLIPQRQMEKTRVYVRDYIIVGHTEIFIFLT